jgi:hypothetical protein
MNAAVPGLWDAEVLEGMFASDDDVEPRELVLYPDRSMGEWDTSKFHDLQPVRLIVLPKESSPQAAKEEE